MIRTFRAINYGCFKDITATLQPLHAFVGPNDSGKSTLLFGMRSLVQFACSGSTSVEAINDTLLILFVSMALAAVLRKDRPSVLSCPVLLGRGPTQPGNLGVRRAP